MTKVNILPHVLRLCIHDTARTMDTKLKMSIHDTARTIDTKLKMSIHHTARTIDTKLKMSIHHTARTMDMLHGFKNTCHKPSLGYYLDSYF